MPLELQIIRANDFVRLHPQGHLNFDESKRALELLAHACRKRGLDRALLDLRGLPMPSKPLFTPSELALLVETFREAGFGRHQRLAVLYRKDPHRGARVFAFISRLRGWQVRALADFEEAMLWLSEEKPKRPAPGGEEIPIHVVPPRLPPKPARTRVRVEGDPA